MLAIPDYPAFGGDFHIGACGLWEMVMPTDFFCYEVFPNNHSFTTDKDKKADGFLISTGDMKIKAGRME